MLTSELAPDEHKCTKENMTIAKSISYADFKLMRMGPRRRELVRQFLASNPGIQARIAARIGIQNRANISHVLHGRKVSAPIEAAIEAEELNRSKAKVA